MCRLLILLKDEDPDVSPTTIKNAVVNMALEKTGETHEHLETDPNFTHPDGWGAAWGDIRGNITVFKSPRPVFEDTEQLTKIIQEQQGSIMSLFHSRKASPGYQVQQSNVHPFFREVPFKQRNQRVQFIFAHNGEVKKPYLQFLAQKEHEELHELSTRLDSLDPLKRTEVEELIRRPCKPEGTTDSERFFCYLLNNFPRFDKEDYIRPIDPALLFDYLRSLPTEAYSGLNFVLASRFQVILNVQHRTTPRYYTMKKTKFEGTHVISSEKFTFFDQEHETPVSLPWSELKHHSLIEFYYDLDEKRWVQGMYLKCR